MPRHLGQHFLRDKKILLSISQAIEKLLCKSTDTIIEIGPGKGALTKYICDIAKTFSVVEKDKKMEMHLLKLLSTEQIIREDVLQWDYSGWLMEKGGPLHLIVGNLPYYITSPILRMFFEKETKANGGIFLIQKEVADKIKHNAEKKSYLRRLLNNSYTVSYIKTVKPSSFTPPPKVQSAVIKLERKKNPEYEDTEKLLKILDYLSPYKRKTLGKIQKMVGKDNLSIPESLQKMRTEELNRETMSIIEVM